MDGKFHIKLQIVGRYYPMVIERRDEEKFRKAARLINEKVAQYKQRYKDRDIQDFLSMASLQFVLSEMEMEGKSDETPLVSVLKEMNEELDEFLKKE